MVDSDRLRHLVVYCLILLLAVAYANPASAESSISESISDSLLPFLAAGEAMLYFRPGDGKTAASQAAKAVAVTYAATELLKRTVREERPDGSDNYSFPSAHASTSFAMATTLAEYYPDKKWQVYGAAALIAWSRVDTDKHHWHDVAAGAALGYFTAKQFAGKHISASPTGIAFHARF